jgi:type II secretory pathway pseudopilin PulG
VVHGLGGGAVSVTNTTNVRRGRRDDERGVIAVLFAIVLVVVLSVTALVIDLGNARQLRRAAQAGADAAVLAGGEAIESGMTQSTGVIPWSTVVTQIKNYAKANDNIALSAWVGCTDASALGYLPDSGNSNSCISASTETFPAPSAASVGDNIDYLRVRLPSAPVKSFFSKALGNSQLVVGATAQIKVVFTVQQVSTPSVVAGGPCALCILGQGYTLDGQNGDVTIVGGNVIVNSIYAGGSCNCAASLNPNGHVRLTIDGGAIGGPAAPGNFNGGGFSPVPTQQNAVADPLANVPQCGDGSPGTINYCPTSAGDTANANKNNKTLTPGIYSTISGSHTLSPGIYIITNGITLSGSDLIQGDGVMLYFGCSNYPNDCPPANSNTSIVRAGITATGNGAMRVTGITQAQCTANANFCPYVGMMDFADRDNNATQTWRGNGTNENGQQSGISGTIYMYSGQMDLRGNGYQMASQIVVDRFTMNGNPSTVTISYDLTKNYTETHIVGVSTYAGVPDNNGLSG